MERLCDVTKRTSLGYARPQGLRFARVMGLDMYYQNQDDWCELEVLDPNREKFGHQRRVMGVTLVQTNRFRGSFTVEMVSVDSLYQGHGLAHKVYRKFLKNHPGFLLRAGERQSPGGRYIWNNLAKYSDINVFVMPMRGNRVYDVMPDPVAGELELYHDDLYDNPRRKFVVFAHAT